MRAALALLAASVSAACVDRRVIDVPVDDQSFEYGFMVLRDEQGSVTRVSAPFGVAEGALTFGSLPAFDLSPDEAEMLLVMLPAGAVRASAPAFDELRAATLELLVTPPPEVPWYERTLLSGELLTVQLPSGARALRSDLDGTLGEVAIPAGYVLRVPIAPEKCSRIEPAGLVPFGVSAEIIPGDRDSELENFVQVSLLGEDVAIAMTSKALHLFRANEPYVPAEVTSSSPGNRLGRDALPIRGHAFGGFVVERDARRVWLAGTFGASEGRIIGILFDLAVAPSAISIAGTATVSDIAFVDVTLDPEGRPLILGAFGEILRYEGAGLFAALPPIGGFDPVDEIGIRIITTGDAELPYLASSKGRLHLFEAAADAWDSLRLEMFRARGLAASRTASGELELWAAGSDSRLLRKVGRGDWQRFEVIYPPRFLACAAGAYPGLTDADGFDGIELVGEDIFLTVRDCSAALQIRRDGTCTALLSVDGTDPNYQRSDLQAIDVLGDTVVLGGEDGLLYRARLR